MAYHDLQYLNLLRDIITNGSKKGDRTGTGTTSVFGRSLRFDLSDGTVPLLTTKKMHVHSIITELLWFISGDTNIKHLQENKVRIWNEWADEDGDLGPVYGSQWRFWEDYKISHTAKTNDDLVRLGYEPIGVDFSKSTIYKKTIDQLQNAIDRLKTKPNCRRIRVSAWNPGMLVGTADNVTDTVPGFCRLPPCHYEFFFYHDQGKLSLGFSIRSNDMFLGFPFNIAQYAILLHMVAQVTNMAVGDLFYIGHDVHLYSNHMDQVNEQLSRTPYESPTIWLNPEIKNIDDFKYDDIKIIGYKSHDAIKAKVAI